MAEPECPTTCDWPKMSVHVQAEMTRIATTLMAVSTRLDGLWIQLSSLIQQNKGDTDTKLHVMMEDVTRQLLVLSDACKANAEACRANSVDIAGIKAAMAKSVAIYGSMAGFLAAAIPFIVQLIRGKV